LFIYSYLNINSEAIILAATNELWYKGISPHLPLMIGYSMCESNKNIDNIVTERHGLDKKVKIDMRDRIQRPIQRTIMSFFESNLATLGNLFRFIDLTQKNYKTVLPNNITCDIIKLIDYLTISYLHTHHILYKNNITMMDMHPDNVFIHWLNNKSYMSDKNISKTKYIVYKLSNKKYIKIQTFGLLLKVGDIGASIYQPKKNIYVLGACGNIKKCPELVKIILQQNYVCYKFMIWMLAPLPLFIKQKTTAWKILSNHPYDKTSWEPDKKEIIKDMLTPIEMLYQFTDYIVKQPKINDTTLII
jgi:hypothetical protein